jgi:hypothetical protein
VNINGQHDVPREERQSGNEPDQIATEREKLQVEREKLQVERHKARWSAIGAIVPIVVAFATITYGAWSLKETARMQFEAKLAELALAAPDPDQARNRARLIAALFQDLLPREFAIRLEQLDPGNFGTIHHPDTVAQIATKKQLFDAIARQPGYRREIITAWKALFPDDKWIDDLK